MGKNHRHKKNLKADKAKVKLKQSKTNFLPKGLNETKATFKIKPIVLSEQLKEKNSQIPLSRRKLDVKDLCNRLNHYNENVRSSACEELVEMFKQYSEEIGNLGEIILNVSNLMQDRERKVRSNAAKVISTILETTPREKLEPFFNYFSTNMRCAMTNINHNIQEDSLKFLDCFLINDCGLISKTSDKLLPDFFTLISRLRVENNLSRTVTVNLGSKMTSVSWRIKVLSRLHTILELILNKNKDINEEVDNVTCFASNNYYIPIYKNSFYKILSNRNSNSDKSTAMDKNTLDSHVVSLIPVLYEIWMEVVPQNKVQKPANESTCLSNEASAILSSVVKTIYLLWKYLEDCSHDYLKSIFMSAEANKFFNNLLINFPYAQNENFNNNKKVKVNALSLNTNLDSNCVRENIIICHIYFILNATFIRNTAKNELKRIADYINKCLLTKNYVNLTSIDDLINFIKISLVEKCIVWKKSNVSAVQILENLIVFYNNGTIKEKHKIVLFKMLAELVENPYLVKSSQYQNWLLSLTESLCKTQINDITIEILLELARKNCVTFLTAVKKNMRRILNNISSNSIIITKKGYKDEKILRREMAFIFYYIKELTCEEAKELLKNLVNILPEQDCNIIKEQVHICKQNSC
ncbi:testis-expressed protein 10 homolog [Diorhabda carinulata]|uniref:testis-expressed protein 10 homolog n=1 Tax=Diorhabda carinulata TaxID=1163345 RepID=UPI0025A18F8D|nr:testis-expressed protein 10 homolog [Diorhabda carinulata]